MKEPFVAICCFCGQTIESRGDDPCALALTTRWDRAPDDPPSQGMWCHATCLRAAVAPGFILGLLEDEPSEPGVTT